MKTGRIVFFMAAAFLFQPAASFFFSVGSSGPDLLLCMMLVLIFTGSEPAVVTGAGAAAGCLRDICFSLYAGPGAAGLFTAGLFGALASRLCNWERLSFRLFFTGLETLVFQSILWAGMKLLGAAWSFSAVLGQIPALSLYNAVFSAGLYMLLSKKKKGEIRI